MLSYNAGMTASPSKDQPETPAASTAPASEQRPELSLQIEAALLTSDRAVGATRLAEALGVESVKVIHAAVKQLNEQYEQTGRSFRIEPVAGGYQVLTLPRFGRVLAALHQKTQQTRLSAAALETLAIVAYKQPVLRAQIEAIRGVACGEVLRSLMDRRLVKIAGRAEEIGRPMLYGTTRTFLETFGLANLNDLPKVESLAAAAGKADDPRARARIAPGAPTDPASAGEAAPSPQEEEPRDE